MSGDLLYATFTLQMMKHAWSGYEKYAWGQNEVRPVTKTGHSASIFGAGNMGKHVEPV
jgi:mannosyl-oligosaccharide alpha-1,2-mannosidase